MSDRETTCSNSDTFPGFARIWACATLVHQLAFTFWCESWQGWILVTTAIAVIFQPRCFYRFMWLVFASLLNLYNKLPFVPNHILFEGILHITMVLVFLQILLKKEGITFLKKALNHGWQSKFLLGVLVVKAIYHLVPGIPNNNQLGIITTSLLALAIGLHLFGRKPVYSGDPFMRRAAPVLRIAVVMMYFWAAIQKTNFDYLNTEISCASRLHIEIANYFGEIIPTKTWALHGAIWGSLLFEFGIPILLMIPKTRVLGFFSAVWFHLWLSMHHAAGIFSFSSIILALLYLFLPVGGWKELMSLFDSQLRKLGGGDIGKGKKRIAAFVTICFFTTLFIQIYLYLSQGRSYEVFSKANRVGYCAFVTWGLWLGICYLIATVKGRKTENFFPQRPVMTLAWIGLLLILINGASPWLGGKTQTSFSMYSNLRSEGKGNHVFLKRIDLLPYQKNLIKVISAEPDLFDPSNNPKGINNFANQGHRVFPYFELRRALSTTAGDFSVSYEQDSEVKVISRKGDTITGDKNLLQPIPLIARKFLWFRRLNAFEGPMPCTH